MQTPYQRLHTITESLNVEYYGRSVNDRPVLSNGSCRRAVGLWLGPIRGTRHGVQYLCTPYFTFVCWVSGIGEGGKAKVAFFSPCRHPSRRCQVSTAAHTTASLGRRHRDGDYGSVFDVPIRSSLVFGSAGRVCCAIIALGCAHSNVLLSLIALLYLRSSQDAMDMVRCCRPLTSQ